VAEATPSSNPYQAPSAFVSDGAVTAPGELIDNGRRVPAGHGAGWYGRAWSLFKAAPGTWILIWLIFMALVVVVSILPFIGWIINLFVQPMLMGGVALACRDAEEGRPVEIPTLFAAFGSHAGALSLLALINLAIYIAVGLIFVIVVAISVGGMAGLGVLSGGFPGPEVWVPLVAIGAVVVVPLMVYGFAVMIAPALIVLRDVAPFDALRMAFVGMIKNVLALLVAFLVFVVLAVLASLPVLLGWLILGPLALCTLYVVYRDVFFAEGTS
jgi:hypothetical protein